ncbi:MAG: phospho-N-acetylmuramoyl-pentapeptide-transferase [Candidatus Eisenbacteria bacterium RBG_16_71_46]|nr:MAG: phospho-N-acetylmuramoyl-pentapeptide-transferase [Candidatus Eisenbacteria bacterium RBG_16_71_46]OGF25035.1 MAG: phospho-N-acetylmuramoyl-pentapeptide-transferase [Candidatus Eisenbacteria bacterium RBG_19FT_COMBO_70_11]
MFYEWVYPLHELPGLSALNVFRYITFRAAYAAITALLVCFVLGPPMIEWLRRVKLGQRVRAEGPQSHLAKAGTPTMGGVLILAAIVVPTLLWGNLHSRPLWLALLATVWLGAIGFLDDYLRVVKGFPKGLLGRYKLTGQFAIGLAIGLILVLWPEPGLPGTTTHVPFLKFRFIDFGWLFVPFVILVITGASNAVNLTDGLDGLASGLMAIAALTFAGMCYLSGHIKISEYLNISYLPYGGELTVFCAAVLGASLGFLWYNCHPADVFMGDTGSLALGGALGTVAVLIKREFWLVLVGGVFVAEAMSVMLQVASFRLWGRRVFRMSPLHHHFELRGWAESRVVLRFYIVGALLALLSLSTFKLQ